MLSGKHEYFWQPIFSDNLLLANKSWRAASRSHRSAQRSESSTVAVVVPDPDAYPCQPFITRIGHNVTLPILGKLE